MRRPTPKQIGSAAVFLITLWAAAAEISPNTFQVNKWPLSGNLVWIAGPVALAWILWLFNSIDNRLSASEQHIIVPNKPILLPGFEFYPSRDLLAVHRPLVTNVKSAREIWVLWNAGTDAGAKNITKTGVITRLLLPHPNSSGLALLAKAVDRDKQDIVSDILVLTKQALENRVEVKWFDTMISDTLTIANPRDPSTASVQLETVIPRVESGDRPAIRVDCSQFDSLFNTLKAAYDERWSDVTNVVPTKPLIADMEKRAP